MPLYRVTFAEHGGWTVTTRIRAPVEANQANIAAQKIWGPNAYWDPSEGRVYEQTGPESSREDDSPRFGPATVTLARAGSRVPRQAPA